MNLQTLFFNRLKPGVKPEDYERWVRDRDYPTARALSTILRYEILRIGDEARSGGMPIPADYLEIVTVTSYDEYDAELRDMPGREEFVTELRSFVDCLLVVRSQTV